MRSHVADFVSAYNFARRLENVEGAHTLRRHLPNVGKTAKLLQHQSNPCRD
jgi:hypothetical protein